MSEKQNKIMSAVMSFLLILSLLAVARESAGLVNVLNLKKAQDRKMTVVIDAGHGGETIRPK